MKRYFEFKDSTSNKFWEIASEGAALTTRYGKIGALGQMTINTFDDKADAKKKIRFSFPRKEEELHG